MIAGPRRGDPMRLHWIVMFVWRAVDLIDLHRRGGERCRGVAFGKCALRPIDCLVSELLDVDARRRFVVTHFDELRAANGVLQRVGDDDGDPLTDVMN